MLIEAPVAFSLTVGSVMSQRLLLNVREYYDDFTPEMELSQRDASNNEVPAGKSTIIFLRTLNGLSSETHASEYMED